MKNKCKKLSDDTYQFPHWSSVSETYSGAVNQVLRQIEKTRPFYNWEDGKINKNTLRETKRKEELIKKCTENGVVTLHVQLGEKYRGKSVEKARELFAEGETGLGAYEVGCILLADTNVLKSPYNLWIDCAGDESSDDCATTCFDHAPLFYFSGGEVKFDTKLVRDAYDDYGDPYRKPTDIWGNFNTKLKQNPVELDSKQKKQSHLNTQDLLPIPEDYVRDPNMTTRAIARSITHPGFAQAFYQANK